MHRRRFLLSTVLYTVTSSTLFAQSNEQSGFLSSLLGGQSQPSDNWSPGRYRGKQIVDYETKEPPGTIIIDTRKRALYHVQPGGKALAYGVGVGRRGFRWSGTAHIGRKTEWPAWHPPKEMIKRERRRGKKLPDRMEGGPENPLGARALYLFQGEKDTLYRIHGTNAPKTIGRALSSGCIRMLNEEVIHLYDHVQIGAKVIVL